MKITILREEGEIKFWGELLIAGIFIERREEIFLERVLLSEGEVF